jgi:hypothetical protein
VTLREYGPVLAAVIALAGAIITLFVTTSRARREWNVAREDSYRADARAELAKLLTAARDFHRHGRAMSDTEHWVRLGADRATALADSTENSMQRVQESLVTAGLLLTDRPLQDALRRLQAAADSAAAVIHEVVDSFWESREPKSFVAERSERWTEYVAACDELYSLGLDLLRPSIRDNRRAALNARGASPRPSPCD